MSKSKKSLRDVGRALSEERAGEALETAMFSKPKMPDYIEELEFLQRCKDKLDAGGTLTAEEQERINVIAQAIIDAFRPVFEAMRQLADQFSGALQDLLSTPVWADLLAMSQTIGEPEQQQVETVNIVGQDGTVIDTLAVTPMPAPSAMHVGLAADRMMPDLELASPMPERNRFAQMPIDPLQETVGRIVRRDGGMVQ